MFRFMQRFGRDSQARGRGTGPMTRVRRRNHQLNCEALESRQLLSGYYIVNAASGKVLDDPGGSTSNGTSSISGSSTAGPTSSGTSSRWGTATFTRWSTRPAGMVLDNPGLLDQITGPPSIQWPVGTAA